MEGNKENKEGDADYEIELMNHPLMKEINPLKLSRSKRRLPRPMGRLKALAPVMMTLITSAKKNGIQFTGEEMAFFNIRCSERRKIKRRTMQIIRW